MNNKQDGKEDEQPGLVERRIFQQGDNVKEDHHQGQEPGEKTWVAVNI